MKKILSIFLISILLFSSISCVTFADPKTDFVSKQAAIVFERLGIVSLSDIETEDVTPVSRASYASMVASALKLSESEPAIYFNDVLRNHYAVSSINALYERGLISGTDGKNFSPDENISFAAALKIMLTAAGYGEYALGKGGFPTGYIIAGQRLDVIPDNINSDGTITLSQATELIYNIMKLGLYDPLIISSDGTVVKEVISETLLSTTWNIYVKEGIIEACYGGSISEKTAGRDEIIIDDEKYFCDTGFKADSYLAEHIEFIYEEVDKDTRRVFYAESSDIQKTCKVIFSKSLLSFDKNTYTIEYENENGSKKGVKLDRGILVIYNGSVYEGSITEIISEFTSGYKKGSVKIIDSAIGGRDTMIVESYRNFVVNYADAEGRKFYNKIQTGDVIDLDKYEEVLIRNLSDIDTQLSGTDSGYPFAVAESKDLNRIKIVTLTTVVTGSVEAVSSKNKVIVDGIAYEFDKALAENMLFDKNGNIMSGFLKTGSSYKFYLDQYGYIAYIIETDPSSAYKVGYLIACDIDNNGLSSGLKLKILSEENTVEIIDVEDKVTIDENKYTSSISVLKAVELAAYEVNNTDADISDVVLNSVNPVITPQLIRFQLNSDGKIFKIDTSHVSDSEDVDYSLTRQEHIDGLDRPIYRQHTLNDGHFGSAILYKKGTTGVFMVPLTDRNGNLIAETDPSTVLSGNITVPALGSLTPVKTNIYDRRGGYAKASESLYVFSKTQSFYSDSRYAVVAYNYTKDSPYTDAIVCVYNKYIENENAIMFEGISTGLDSEGNVCTLLKGWEAGSEVSYVVGDNSNLADLELGDLLYTWIDNDKKEIAFIKKVYDASENDFVNLPHTYDGTRKVPDAWWSIMYNTYNASTGEVTGYQHASRWILTKGKVLDKNQNVLYWDWDGNYRNYEEAMDISTVPVVICDFALRNNNVRIGTIGDITDYNTVGDDCSYLVMNMRHSQGKCAYIYINTER